MTPHASGLVVGGGKHDFTGQPDAAFLRTDTWGHATCATAAGGLDKSASDCDDGKPCTLDGCEAGQCTATPNQFALPCGGGYCSKGTCQGPPASCLELRNAAPGSASGVFGLQKGGGGVNHHWCDQSNDDGGWTLVLRIDAAKQTFAYDGPGWTYDTVNVFNTDAPGLQLSEAKLPGYYQTPTAQARVGIYRNGVLRSVVTTNVGCSLLSQCIAGGITTKVGSASWHATVPDFKPTFSGGQAAEGFSVGVPYSHSVRIGWVWAGGAENSLAYGVGLKAIPGYPVIAPAAGAHYASGMTGGYNAAPGFGFVWVR